MYTARNVIVALPRLRSKMQLLEREQELIREQGGSQSECSSEYMQTAMDLAIAEASMRILNKREQEIVEKHIIWKYTWSEIMEEYEKDEGLESAISERSLKRIQENALKKIDDFLKDLKR